jgi:hypothetical protein
MQLRAAYQAVCSKLGMQRAHLHCNRQHILRVPDGRAQPSRHVSPVAGAGTCHSLSPQNFYTMIQRVTYDHVPLLVNNDAPERMVEVTVVESLSSHNAHMGAISTAQHMYSVRTEFDDNHVDAAVKR